MILRSFSQYYTRFLWKFQQFVRFISATNFQHFFPILKLQNEKNNELTLINICQNFDFFFLENSCCFWATFSTFVPFSCFRALCESCQYFSKLNKTEIFLYFNFFLLIIVTYLLFISQIATFSQFFTSFLTS